MCFTGVSEEKTMIFIPAFPPEMSALIKDQMVTFINEWMVVYFFLSPQNPPPQYTFLKNILDNVETKMR